jgi:hypothetical protein
VNGTPTFICQIVKLPLYRRQRTSHMMPP